MIVRYILKSVSIVEVITLEYYRGCLSGIIMPLKHPLTLDQYDKLIPFIPYFEENIKDGQKLCYNIYVHKEIGANVKIAMFCTHYMKAYGSQKYTATAQDGKRIRAFKVWDDLLEYYFISDNFLFKAKHSVANFTKYYNELVAEFNNKGKSKYPDHWTEAYQNGLKTQQQLNDYWAHLRILGLEPKKDRVGKTIDWIKKV